MSANVLLCSTNVRIVFFSSNFFRRCVVIVVQYDVTFGVSNLASKSKSYSLLTVN